jgi:hypothetical protein
LGVGCWVLGVGCWVLGARQGRPGVRRLKGVGSLSRRLFRAALAGTPPPDLAAAPHLAAAAPKGEGTRAPSRRLPPKHRAGSRRGPNTLCTRRYREAEEKILGVGCSILGVGCLRIWALGVYHRAWVLGGTGHLLGVGCWVLGVGRWMPLAKALGGVGGPREATARWEHK